jgi:DNA polymerase I-like protein with 3'-5' exonuclease and polymerase domains
VVRLIEEERSLGVFMSTFIRPGLDVDGRFRTSLNPAGPYTYRLSSSKNAFWGGGNMQNIPGHAHPEDDTYLELPNIRELFGPDPGKTYFEGDLNRADLFVVVWEAEDEELKVALSSGVDLHLFNMRKIYDIDLPDDEIMEDHPKCREHKERHYAKRHFTKEGVHAVNYYCQSRTLALTLNCTVHEADKFRRSWLSLHPGIPRWHARVERDLASKHQVRNKFGYIWRVFSRTDNILPEALAWIPQSTVARVINEAWVRIEEARTAEIHLQGHDSLIGQFPTAEKADRLAKLHEQMLVTVPYDDPLVIPVSIKTSETSWGNC